MSFNRERRSSSVGNGSNSARGLSDSPRTPSSGKALFTHITTAMNEYQQTFTEEFMQVHPDDYKAQGLPIREKCRKKIVNLFAQLFEIEDESALLSEASSEKTLRRHLRASAKDAIACNNLSIPDIQRLMFILRERNTAALLATEFSGISEDNVEDFIKRLEKTTYPYQLKLELDAAVFAPNVLKLLSRMINTDGSLTLEAVSGIEKISSIVVNTLASFKNKVIDMIAAIENPVSSPKTLKSSSSSKHTSKLLIASKKNQQSPLMKVHGDAIDSKSGFSNSAPSLATQDKQDRPILKTRSLPEPSQSQKRANEAADYLEYGCSPEQLKVELENGSLKKALVIFANMMDRYGHYTPDAIANIENMLHAATQDDVGAMIAVFKKLLMSKIAAITYSGNPSLRAESPRVTVHSPSLSSSAPSSPSTNGSPRLTSSKRDSRPKLVLTSRVQDVKKLLQESKPSESNEEAPSLSSPSISTVKPTPSESSQQSVSSNNTWESWSYDEDKDSPSTTDNASLNDDVDTLIIADKTLITSRSAIEISRKDIAPEHDAKKNRLSIPKLEHSQLFASSGRSNPNSRHGSQEILKKEEAPSNAGSSDSSSIESPKKK